MASDSPTEGVVQVKVEVYCRSKPIARKEVALLTLSTSPHTTLEPLEELVRESEFGKAVVNEIHLIKITPQWGFKAVLCVWNVRRDIYVRPRQMEIRSNEDLQKALDKIRALIGKTIRAIIYFGQDFAKTCRRPMYCRLHRSCRNHPGISKLIRIIFRKDS